MHEHKADLRASKFTLDPTLESELPVELTIETTSETEVLAAEVAKSAANQEYNAASKTDGEKSRDHVIVSSGWWSRQAGRAEGGGSGTRS